MLLSWNLNNNLVQSASKYPAKHAYTFLGQQTTYQELDNAVERFSAHLSAQGIGKGDAVALLLGNTPSFIISFYGILRTGAAAVPINPIYTTREITYILTNCQAKAVIAHTALQPLLISLKDKLPQSFLCIYDDFVEGESSIKSWLQQGDTPPIPQGKNSGEDDLAVILYTSGTTGDPKGAMLSHRNLASNAAACVELFKLTKEDRVVTVLPIFHVFCMTACLNSAIACGATILLLPKFSPTEVVRTIREERATIFAGVPTMYNFLLQLPEPVASDFTSLRGCISGGAAMPITLLNKFEERYRVKVLEGYGLSEASPVTHFNPLDGVRKPGSIGMAIPGVQNKVVDEDGQEVPRGEIGELIVKGPNVMIGYMGMPEATRFALRDGWLYTGDMANMDEDGYIYIVDRKKDMILVGGYNVYPREVEEVLYKHSAVVEAAVVGAPDEEQGEVVKAVIVSSDSQLTGGDIIQFCQDKLAKYKIPKQIEFVASLPKNSTGKIIRKALK
jgi:long-chain acyl-CoA synthetase